MSLILFFLFPLNHNLSVTYPSHFQEESEAEHFLWHNQMQKTPTNEASSPLRILNQADLIPMVKTLVFRGQ